MAKIEKQGYSSKANLSSRTTRKEELSPKSDANTQSVESLHMIRNPSFGFGLRNGQPRLSLD